MKSPDDVDPLQRRAVFRNPLVWLCGFTYILINAVLAKFTSNILQRRFVEVVLFCLKHNLPIRIIVLKPRQRGISTISVGVLQWLLWRWPGRGVIVGRKGKQTDNLWRMFRRYHEHDEFPWGAGIRITDEEAVYETGASVTKESAEAMDPGRSDTFQAMLATEIAYWGGDGKVKNASGVFAGFMACVKAMPHTYVVQESTSAGPSGLFYRQWQDAVTFEEFKANPVKHKGAFVRVFAGVFEFEDCCDEVADDSEAAAILDGVGALNDAEREREKRLKQRYGLSAGQIKFWRRILKECDNDPAKRDLDYPCEPEDAFQAGQLCRFNWAGLALLRTQAMEGLSALQWGGFVRQYRNARPVWTAHGTMEQGGDFVIAEHPIVGCKYTITVDTMKGKSSGDDRRNLDCHAVHVRRVGYFDGTGKWRAPKIVASVTGERRRMGGILRMEARWEIDYLVDRVMDLHEFYGKAIVIVENNNDPGLLPMLKQRGCRLYVELFDEKDVNRAGEEKGKLGFTMGDNGDRNGVRSTILTQTAIAIGEVARGAMPGIEVPFPWILDECEHFVNDPDTGRAEAAEGWHDDQVMCLAIGQATEALAVTYIAPPVTMPDGTAGMQGHHSAVPAMLDPGARA